MHDQFCNHCPDWNDDKNRFQPENRFVGDIEDGKRYPFDVYKKSETYSKEELYTKAESDEKYATELEAVDIRARLDALEYKGIVIESLQAAPAICELGSSNTVNVSWTLNKPATAQNINGTPVEGTSQQYAGVNSARTYTLNVSDGTSDATSSVSIAFENYIYYGTAIDLTSVTALENKVLSGTKSRTITVNAQSGNYIVYALPARLGEVQFYVSGFEGGFNEAAQMQITNSIGYTETYNVYQSVQPSLGRVTIEVR